MRVRELCYEGDIHDSNMNIARGHTPTENVIPGEEESYMLTGMKKEISGTKFTDLLSMYNNFIPHDRRLDFLPPP